MKLYSHETNGGAKYLMDTFIQWRHNGKSGKEGTVNENTRILIRMDGKQPEIIQNAAAEERDELLVALEGMLNCFDERGYPSVVQTNLLSALTTARAAIAKAQA